MYADLNGDGEISNGANTLADHGDLKIIGNNTPRYNYGITLDAAYKGSVASAISGITGGDDWLTAKNEIAATKGKAIAATHFTGLMRKISGIRFAVGNDLY